MLSFLLWVIVAYLVAVILFKLSACAYVGWVSRKPPQPMHKALRWTLIVVFLLMCAMEVSNHAA